MKSILITGGNGFVGTEVSRHAIKLGWKVVSVSRKGREGQYQMVMLYIFIYLKIDKVEYIKGDAYNP